MNRKRRIFQTSEPAYRAFLIQFDESKSFNDACITPALDHAYSKIFKNKIRPDIRSHLVKVIIDSKEKVLNDLKTLKDSPDSKIEPLGRKKKLSNDDIGKMTKKRKLNNTDVSQEKTAVESESKENHFHKRSSKRNSTKNKSLKRNLRSDEKSQNSGVASKILKVTIENDKNIHNMVNNCTDKSKDHQNQSTEIRETRDTNVEENEKLHVTQDLNESIEIEQSFSRLDGNDNSVRVEGLCIKKEIDLMDHSFQGNIPIPLPEDRCTVAQVTLNNASSLAVDNQSNVSSIPLLSVNSQENVSSLNIACYNNIMPPVQSFNQMPHINCCPCTFLHHPMVMNNPYGYYHGMYNFPVMHPFPSHLHHAVPAFQNGLQAPAVNQITENSTTQNPPMHPFVGNRSANQLLSLQHELQQLQTNQITENRLVNQSLHLQNSMQSIQANQFARNNPATVLNPFQPAVQQHMANQFSDNVYSSPQSASTAHELARLQTAIFNLNSQLVSLQNAWNQSQS